MVVALFDLSSVTIGEGSYAPPHVVYIEHVQAPLLVCVVLDQYFYSARDCTCTVSEELSVLYVRGWIVSLLYAYSVVLRLG